MEALKALVLAAARHQPLVLILEDVHWIDKATEEVLAALVEAMATVPLLLVLVYRPEYLHAWAHKAYHTQVALTRLPSASSVEMVRAILTKPYATRIALERLSPTQSMAMVQELLGSTTLPPELEQLIATKTDGNPLFIEELTRSLLESGACCKKPGATYHPTAGDPEYPTHRAGRAAHPHRPAARGLEIRAAGGVSDWAGV